MIASLKGTIVFKSPTYTIVEVRGVGYKVFLSSRTLEKLPTIGQEVFLFIHTAVREDDISLYGFVEENEKTLFEKLITVNGIGNKLALTILSGIPPEELLTAIRREDLVRLTSVPGIGKKTAERMIVDLKDKLMDLLVANASTDPKGGPVGRDPMGRGPMGLFEEALSALMNLGYQRNLAEKTLSRIPLEEGIALESLVRQALRSMTG